MGGGDCKMNFIICTSHIFRVTKSRRMSLNRDEKCTLNFSWKTWREEITWRFRHRWKDNNTHKMYFKEEQYGLDLSGSGLVAVSCEHNNKFWSSIKDGESFKYLVAMGFPRKTWLNRDVCTVWKHKILNIPVLWDLQTDFKSEVIVIVLKKNAACGQVENARMTLQ
jgi:hypothetical protein